MGRPIGNMLSWRMVALCAIVLAFAGFYAGVREEKAQGTSSSSTGSAESLRRFTAAAGSTSEKATASGATPSFGPPATSAAGGVAGTVERIAGDVVYVKEASGKTVKVRLASATTTTKQVKVDADSVHPGDSVTVSGSQGTGGAIKATAVTDAGDSDTTTTSTATAG